ncbi:UDP-glycosyltransferase UGT5-like [Neodiprion virginianus]|uniref:UDP-glycosyltransferase UGT5-like n=1 Tax=Neodiprion virginianus TaxID=2961670 RepID=UPI001EE6C424|nr:UDP-glycosyltransferase UGT5-like [Neodiprion virginianus]XP_046628501.1 UDP-glycosyltransferase UGT5-like [Neodiprion virginianus]XP_046628502.1 UDP-glycosyltransferase UGT5-like [Neodiprion virginianus]XP_046628503.1 UDP-glycosyltransferase UGT5-like [Neodiprion virginianus]
MNLIATCFVLGLAGGGEGARILGLFPIPGKSHLLVTSPLMHALAKKGHDVTVFVPFHTGFNASNYREITYESIPLDKHGNIMDYLNMNIFLAHIFLYYMGTVTTEMALNTTGAQALIKSEEKFDIIVMEQFFNEAFLAYVHKFKCPFVLISAFGPTATINGIFGNSAPYSYVPSEFLPFGDRMTFFERLENTIANLYFDGSRKYYYMPQQQALANKYLSDTGKEVPSLEEIESQADLILLNSHHIFSTPRPYMENMKNVAGMHLKPSKPLPLDLQQYMNSSKNGVILFSLGSAMQSILMPDDKIKALKGAFERLPYDVLWKWENDTMENKPKNVRIGKWLPQSDILTHPNLKLFVTHGGISSLMETVYHEVPIVGIPLFGDQRRNIKIAESKGYADFVDILTLTENQVYNAIMNVATNPKYRDNVKKVSAYWKGEMNHPLDVAVHWVEYVLKNGGAKLLKATVTEQNFIQYFLLDVGFAILLLLILTCILIRKTFRLLCRKSRPKMTSKKNN